MAGAPQGGSRAGRRRRRAAAQSLRDAMRELGIVSLPWYAIAEVRDAERALQGRAIDDAVEHATVAVALAPDLPEPHLALARARFAAEPTRPLPALRAAVGRRRRRGEGSPRGAGAPRGPRRGGHRGALRRRGRHHLHPLPVAAAHLPARLPAPPGGPLGDAGPGDGARARPARAAASCSGSGPSRCSSLLSLAAWAYLSRWERIAVTASLLALVAIPALAGQAARVTAWQGTLADDVHEIEAGWPTPEFVAEMKVRSTREQFPAPALLAIGRWHKRQGDLAEARRWYEAALAADPRSAEAQVNLGNVLFLEGDLEGAKAAYLAAVERARDLSTLAAAQYDLSKLHLRLAAVGPSSEARRKAQQADAAYLARHGSDDDFRANAWLVDALPSAGAPGRASPPGTPCPAPSGDAALRRVAGPLARWGWPLLPLGARRPPSGSRARSRRASPRRRRASGAGAPPAVAATRRRTPAAGSA